jgi:hypothetical protein
MKDWSYYKKIADEAKIREREFYQKLIETNRRSGSNKESKALFLIYSAYYNKTLINVTIKSKTIAGFIVDLYGKKAFLPQSVSFIPKKNAQIKDNEIQVHVVKVNSKELSFVVSRYKIVQELLGEKHLITRKDDIENNHDESTYDSISKLFYTCDDFEEQHSMKRREDGGESEEDIMRALKNGYGEIFGF